MVCEKEGYENRDIQIVETREGCVVAYSDVSLAAGEVQLPKMFLSSEVAGFDG